MDIPMKNAGTITFIDSESGAEALAIVRYNDKEVAICLSLKTNGDLEVVMPRESAISLFEALRIAIQ